MDNLTDWVPVVSSRIAQVRYLAGEQILDVQFKRGRTYRYAPVPEELFNEVMTADSIGAAFSFLIVDNENIERAEV